MKGKNTRQQEKGNIYKLGQLHKGYEKGEKKGKEKEGKLAYVVR